MSFTNANNQKSKHKPASHKGALNSHNVKLKHALSKRKCNCAGGNYHSDNNDEITCKDGNRLLARTCNSCESTTCKCAQVIYCHIHM